VAGGDPISYLLLEKGTDVVSADGERVGTVQHVLGDEEKDIFDGLVIDTKLGPGGLRFVDAPQIAELREDAAVLTVAAADVPALPEPTPGPAVMESHGVEDAESPLERKLRRAWEIVSGKP
jgi:hypothetical protein